MRGTPAPAARYSSEMKPRRGHYLGTEIDGAWHKRYRKEGMFARGLGEYWIQGDELCFRRYLTKKALRIPLRKVTSIGIGKWHAGRWVGSKRAIKLVWEREGMQLSSGFVLTRTSSEAAARCRELRELIDGLNPSSEALGRG